jgi:hypothetical protein
MRIAVVLVLALGACSEQGQPEGQAQSAQPALTPATMPAAAALPAQSSPLMTIPEDPDALKRLEAMGYTIHAEQEHLHAPGVTSCPKMGDDPVM